MPIDVLLCMRDIYIPLTELMSCEESDVQNRHIAMDISIVTFPLERIGPVSALVMRGISIPTSVTASVARTMRVTSFAERQLFIYSMRSEMPIFLWGRGR